MTQPISWNEIQDRAKAFTKEWASASHEEADAKPFLIAFFEVFAFSSARCRFLSTTLPSSTKAWGKSTCFGQAHW